MKNQLPKPIDGITDIKPHELHMEQLTSKKLDMITEFVNRKNKHIKFMSVFAFVIGTVFAIIFLLATYNSNITTDDIITIIGFTGIFYLVGYINWKQQFPPATHITGLMTGTLNTIWWMTSTKKNKRKYYLDVVFTTTNMRLKNVQCSKQLIETLSPNDLILVFTWNGNTAFGLKLN